jgi:small subunit ribosomal protein S1
VADGIEGLVHISELSSKHVEHADQVVTVNQDVFVKLIDIDLERRRISLSLKQAVDEIDPQGADFNPVLYGMGADYDENGSYRYPEGFDPSTNEWRSGFEEVRAKWEADYAQAQERWRLHKVQVQEIREKLADLPDAAISRAPEGPKKSEAKAAALTEEREQLDETD